MVEGLESALKIMTAAIDGADSEAVETDDLLQYAKLALPILQHIILELSFLPDSSTG
jgi:hypothetical protein